MRSLPPLYVSALAETGRECAKGVSSNTTSSVGLDVCGGGACADVHGAVLDLGRRGECDWGAAAPRLSKRLFGAVEPEGRVCGGAASDPKTQELTGYLSATGVGELLDAPIYRDGAMIGVVCHEHCGGTRRWTEMEASFASAVADTLTNFDRTSGAGGAARSAGGERQAEARMEKMQALQRLARAVAHDLNNVLTQSRSFMSARMLCPCRVMKFLLVSMATTDFVTLA
ncbi:MAG TPA: GAF domain-containing protein [Polyangiaceae bacterium]|nr:GAF domain-containing protein [Polyangiaceae bacterium]